MKGRLMPPVGGGRVEEGGGVEEIVEEASPKEGVAKLYALLGPQRN